MSPADQLTVARALSVPIVILLYALDFHGHAYWATSVFVVAMTAGMLAQHFWQKRRTAGTPPILMSVVDG